MKIYLLLVLCVSFWAGNFVVGRFIRFDLDPIELAYFRWFCVTLLFVPQIIKHRANIVASIKNHFVYLFVMALLGIAGFNTLLYIGLQQTMATNALMINSSIPILIILFSWMFLKQQITKVQLLGVLLSMFGVVFLVLNGSVRNLLMLSLNQGDIWVFGSSILWATYSILLRYKPASIDAFLPTIVPMGLFILTPVFFLHGYHISHFITLSNSGKLAILYTAVFASIASYTFWNIGVATIGANKTGQFTHLMPVIGILLAYVFLGERLHMYHVYGIVFIALGLWLSLFYKSNPVN